VALDTGELVLDEDDPGTLEGDVGEPEDGLDEPKLELEELDNVEVAVLMQEQPLEILEGTPGQAVAHAGRVIDAFAVV